MHASGDGGRRLRRAQPLWTRRADQGPPVARHGHAPFVAAITRKTVHPPSGRRLADEAVHGLRHGQDRQNATHPLGQVLLQQPGRIIPVKQTRSPMANGTDGHAAACTAWPCGPQAPWTERPGVVQVLIPEAPFHRRSGPSPRPPLPDPADA